MRAASIDTVSVRKAFFFEKKNQKTFVPSPAARLKLSAKVAAAQKIKVFLLLFLQKKKILSYSFFGGTAGRLSIFASDLIAHLPALRRYATGLAGRAAEADDLVQDCIERALRRQDGLQQRESMGAWLRSILHNVFVDDLRRRRVRGTMVDVRDLEDDLALSTQPEDRAGMQDFYAATMKLSLEHRQILLLVGVEGLSYREVAAELGVPIGTVMSRLARARDRLREALESPGAGAEIVPLHLPRGSAA